MKAILKVNHRKRLVFTLGKLYGSMNDFALAPVVPNS